MANRKNSAPILPAVRRDLKKLGLLAVATDLGVPLAAQKRGRRPALPMAKSTKKGKK